MRKRQMAITAALLIIVLSTGLLLGFFFQRFNIFLPKSRYFSSPAILQQVRGLAELVTVEYVIEKIIVLEDVKWIAGLGENRVLMIAHGVVKAGMDVSRLAPEDIRIDGKRIRIKLPTPKITDAYLDETQTRVIERSTGLLRSFDKDLEQTARQNAVDDIRRAARNGGILKEADKRGRLQLETMFRQMGFETVEFVPK